MPPTPRRRTVTGVSCGRSCRWAETGGTKAASVQRLVDAEAREAEDGEPGASNTVSAVAEACNSPEPAQARRRRQRRVANSESEDIDGGLVDDASIEVTVLLLLVSLSQGRSAAAPALLQCIPILQKWLLQLITLLVL